MQTMVLNYEVLKNPLIIAVDGISPELRERFNLPEYVLEYSNALAEAISFALSTGIEDFSYGMYRPIPTALMHMGVPRELCEAIEKTLSTAFLEWINTTPLTYVPSNNILAIEPFDLYKLKVSYEPVTV